MSKAYEEDDDEFDDEEFDDERKGSSISKWVLLAILIITMIITKPDESSILKYMLNNPNSSVTHHFMNGKHAIYSNLHIAGLYSFENPDGSKGTVIAMFKTLFLYF
ncbi:hypothetical protein ACLBWT_01615 [Paenibacillus sp. D51F]